MFESRKKLKEQLDEALIGLEVKERRINDLDSQRKALMKENAYLRTQIADIRDEANRAMEAKEEERRELCDQLGEAQRLCDKQKSIIEVKTNTIGRLVKENMWLANTNAKLSDFLGLGKNDTRRIKHPTSENQ